MLNRNAVSACIVFALSAVALRAAQPAFIDQGWTDQTRIDFWFMDQGSRIMPMDWFLRLPKGKTLSPDAPALPFAPGLERYGFVPDNFTTLQHNNPSSDPNTPLPIGFTKEIDSNGQAWVGLTCAACHTNRIISGNNSWLIEGAPSMLNFDRFLTQLVQAVDDLASDPNGAGKTFWGGTPSLAQQAQFRKIKDRLDLRARINKPDNEAGFGRVDAFGHIFNQVMSVGLGQQNGLAAPNAPASYPFLWDIAQHNFVQWNGSAPNLGVGRDATGSLIRNIGEVLGVFGEFTVTSRLTLLGLPSYQSSVKTDSLKAIEDWISQLRSPQWPPELGAIDPADRAAGQGVYHQWCETCHEIVPRHQPVAPITAHMTSISDVGTDPAEIDGFSHTADPGILRGRFYLFDPQQVIFGNSSYVRDLTAYVAMGVYVNNEDPQLIDLASNLARAVKTGLPQLTAYKARPLDGIWATAPYLHNGSVASLTQLLTPAKQRLDHFCVGDGIFDPDNVGYQTHVTAGPDGVVTSVNCPSNTSEVNTTLPGSLNTGHGWGTNLSPSQKRQLIAFLKSL